MVKKALLTPLSLLYIAGVKFRHWLFDSSILRSVEFDIPVVCIGNITVGGTGKSPMSEMLIEHLSPNHKVAILSRGYGRKSSGYIEVKSDDSYLKVGDEPLQMKMKYPSVTVVVCESRVEGVRQITKQHPEIELIIMDDGFQHRHIKPLINIIMVDATRPISEDKPLPLGSLRDTTKSLHRADYFVVTKCPNTITQDDIIKLRAELTVEPHQKVLFSKIVNSAPIATYPSEAELLDGNKSHLNVIAMAGIGNPKPFIDTLRGGYNVTKELIFNDHHSYTKEDLTQIEELLKTDMEAVVITTEKDSVKFLANESVPKIIKQRLYFTPIRMQFVDGDAVELLKNIEKLC